MYRGLRLGEGMVIVMGFGQDDDTDLVERASPIDMMELASDVGPVPLQVGAVWCSSLARIWRPAGSAMRWRIGFAAFRVCASSSCQHHRVAAGRSGSTILSSTSPGMSMVFAVHRLATRRPSFESRLAP